MALWLTVPLVMPLAVDGEQQPQGTEAETRGVGMGRTSQDCSSGPSSSPAGSGSLDGWEAWHQVWKGRVGSLPPQVITQSGSGRP